jgi:hypothetical protein
VENFVKPPGVCFLSQVAESKPEIIRETMAQFPAKIAILEVGSRNRKLLNEFGTPRRFSTQLSVAFT